MDETRISSGQISFGPKALTTTGIVLLLGLSPSLHASELKPKLDCKIFSEHSWERNIDTTYYIHEAKIQDSSLVPSELKDQPNYSYNEMIDFLKDLNLPTTFPI